MLAVPWKVSTSKFVGCTPTAWANGELSMGSNSNPRHPIIAPYVLEDRANQACKWGSFAIDIQRHRLRVCLLPFSRWSDIRMQLSDDLNELLLASEWPYPIALSPVSVLGALPLSDVAASAKVSQGVLILSKTGEKTGLESVSLCNCGPYPWGHTCKLWRFIFQKNVLTSESVGTFRTARELPETACEIFERKGKVSEWYRFQISSVYEATFITWWLLVCWLLKAGCKARWIMPHWWNASHCFTTTWRFYIRSTLLATAFLSDEWFRWYHCLRLRCVEPSYGSACAESIVVSFAGLVLVERCCYRASYIAP